MREMPRYLTKWPLLLFLVPAFIINTSYAADYYYYKGRPVYLKPDPSLVGLELTKPAAQKGVEVFRSSPDTFELEEVLVAMPRRGRYVCRTKKGADRTKVDGRLKQIEADPRIRRAFPVYRTPKEGLLVFVFDEIIVRLHPETDEVDFQRLLEARGAEIVQQSRHQSDVYLVRVPPGAGSTLEVANEFARTGLFLWSQPNFGRQVKKANVDDPFFPNQWHLNNTGQTGGTEDADIDALEAWTITTGSPDVVLAIIDDGIELTHEDLAANIFVNPGESGDGRETNGIDDDGNGYIDDVNGWDFFDNDNDPSHAIRSGPSEGHGTAVAGLSAAVGNNGIGVAGVAYSSKLISVKVFRGDVFVGDFEAGEAIRYASTFADILINSWGGGLQSQAIDSAIAFAVETGRGGLGCPMFFASGNDSADVVSYPGRNVWTLAVGASTLDDVRANFSNTGRQLTIMAPTTTWTTDMTGTDAGFNKGDPEGNYAGSFGGTSAATPIAAGAAALLLSLNPEFTPIQLQRFLQATSDRIDPDTANYNAVGFSEQYGYGRVNAHNALVQSQTGGPFLDDPSEDNDTRESAPVLVEGFYSALSALDDDWFAVHVEPLQDIVAKICFLHPHGDLQLELYDPNGVLVADSLGTSNTEEVEAAVGDKTGIWYMRIFGNAGATNYYHLDVQLRPPDDRFEPNDSLGAAVPIAPGDHDDLRGFDPDYYRIHVPSGKKLSVVIDFFNEIGDLDLFLLDEAGNVLSESASLQDIEGVAYLNEGADTDLFILVDNFADSENAYNLQVAIESGKDDAFEENDELAEAALLEPGVYGGLQFFDEDWYRIEVGPNQLLEIEIRFVHSIGDLDLDLYLASNNLVDESFGVANSERVLFYNRGGGTASLYARVYSIETGIPSYDLLIERRNLEEDGFEKNDTFESRSPIGTDTYGDLTVLDDDFYGIDAAAGRTIAAIVVHEDVLDPLKITAWSPTGIEMNSVETGDPSVLVVRNVPTTGTYGIQVGLKSGGEVGLYDLSAFVYTPKPSAVDDRYEPNDTRVVQASFLTTGVYPDLWASNIDFFKIQMRRNDALYVAIVFDGNQADLDLTVYDPFGQVVSESLGTSDAELCVVRRVPRTGYYYIEVSPFEGRTRYDLLIARNVRHTNGFPRQTAARRWQLY